MNLNWAWATLPCKTRPVIAVFLHRAITQSAEGILFAYQSILLSTKEGCYICSGGVELGQFRRCIQLKAGIIPRPTTMVIHQRVSV